jgi:hypothetical protein
MAEGVREGRGDTNNEGALWDGTISEDYTALSNGQNLLMKNRVPVGIQEHLTE